MFSVNKKRAMKSLEAWEGGAIVLSNLEQIHRRVMCRVLLFEVHIAVIHAAIIQWFACVVPTRSTCDFSCILHGSQKTMPRHFLIFVPYYPFLVSYCTEANTVKKVSKVVYTLSSRIQRLNHGHC